MWEKIFGRRKLQQPPPPKPRKRKRKAQGASAGTGAGAGAGSAQVESGASPAATASQRADDAFEQAQAAGGARPDLAVAPPRRWPWQKRRKGSRKRAENEGRKAEAAVARRLRLAGWRILGRRVRTARGEIDLVARRGRTLCYVEIKWRSDPRDFEPAIAPDRLRRVAAAVEAVSPQYRRPRDVERIDVVLMTHGLRPQWLRNVWIME